MIRSIVQLHQMEMDPPEVGNKEEIKATLTKYVKKHVETARKNAHKRALEDQREAYKVYYETSTSHSLETCNVRPSGNLVAA